MFLELFEREDRERRRQIALRGRERGRAALPMAPPRPRGDGEPPTPLEAPCAERGVYRERVCPPGEQWFKIVLSSGKIGIVHLPDDLVDAAMVENLWQRLERRDPILKII